MHEISISSTFPVLLWGVSHAGILDLESPSTVLKRLVFCYLRTHRSAMDVHIAFDFIFCFGDDDLIFCTIQLEVRNVLRVIHDIKFLGWIVRLLIESWVRKDDSNLCVVCIFVIMTYLTRMAVDIIIILQSLLRVFT